MTQPAEIWRALLRRSLMTARKQRDTVRVSALRSMLGAIDNAEAVDVAQLAGVTEVARRELSEEQIRELMRTEIDERMTAANDYVEHGRAEQAAALRAEATVVADLLGDV
jgi:uncharacterized protein